MADKKKVTKRKKKVKDYIILVNGMNNNLEKDVLEYLHGGYELYGYPFANDNTIFQAVIKY